MCELRSRICTPGVLKMMFRHQSSLILVLLQLKKMHMKPATEIDANKGFSVTAVEPEGLPAEEKSPAYPYDLSYTPPSLIR